MRKTIFISGILAALLLTGCFGIFKKDEVKKPAAQERAQQPAAQPPAQMSKTDVPEPPSFQDGDFYLQALSAKSVELCLKIGNTKLRERCETRVKGE